MRCFRNTLFALLAVLFAVPAVQAQDHKLLDKFSSRLDHVERRFWLVAPLPEDHRERPGLNSAINELEGIARDIRHNCIQYEKGAIPELRGDVIMLTRVLFQFKVDSRVKARRIHNLNSTSAKSKVYTSRHNRLVREKAKEQGEKPKKSNSKIPPELSKVDTEDYSEFLDEVNEKNLRRFSSWTNSLESRTRIQNAEQIFAVYQKTISDMRMKLVMMAKYATFKEEKKR